GFDAGGRLGAAAITARAEIEPLVRELAPGAVSRLLEADFDGLPQGSAVASPKPERTQEVAEEVLESPEVGDVGASAPRAEGGLSVTVVRGPFVGVAQDLIGLVDPLEPCLCVGIVGIPIRMVLGRQPAKRGFDFGFGGSS